ncbi:hypothetical protein Pmani_012299 [Petrolisthes manimaculis]|uniref:Ionotropic glutamate receptor C-terminal domain-containing protein n=1 Tax=Petrolisthes manimaculis TaxID=1843537 RepID=A0AAE1Q0Q3_9EUCA|nr:hypothetical protein Pmani_012299 [Petrolisthes manimaculis]
MPVVTSQINHNNNSITSKSRLSSLAPSTTNRYYMEASVLYSLTFFLLQNTIQRDVIIIHDSPLTGSVLGVIESCFMGLADTTLFTYDLATLQRVFASPDHTTSRRYVVVLCSLEHTMEIFTEVRRSSLESRSVRWVVVSEEEVLGLTLSMVLREGTHVGLLVRVEPDLYHIFSSYVDMTSAIRFQKVGSWSVDTTTGYLKQPLFPDMSEFYLDLHGRQLKVTTVSSDPFFTLVYRGEGQSPLPDRGIDANIAQTLATFLNFTYEIVVPADRKWGGPQADGTVTGMIGEVYSHRAHLAICEITITVQRESVTDFTLPYFLESTTLVSPAPSELPRALAVFYPFSTYLWGLLAVVVLLMGPLVFLVSRGHDLSVPVVDPSLHSQQQQSVIQTPELGKENRDLLASVSATCFNVFRTIVIQGNLLPARSWPIRLVLFSWFAFCVILYALYSGTLTAYMTKPSFEPPIDSLEDALEAHRRFGFVPVAQQGTSNLRLWRVMNEKVMYMTPKLNSEVRATQRGRHRFHIARNTFLYQGYGIACRIGSPLTTVFDIM